MESKFNLIKGNFTAQEAALVISNLLDFKIQYHSRQNFSSEIRNGMIDIKAKSRRDELIEIKSNILEMLRNMDPDTRLTLNSEIVITKNEQV